MKRYWRLLPICFVIAGCSLALAQSTKTSIPQYSEDSYVSREFGNCTFAYGKDRSRYIQPFVICKSGGEIFSLVPQEDGTWALTLSPGDETERSEDEERRSILEVIIKVDNNEPHTISMLWPKNWNRAFKSYELTEIVVLLDQLRNGNLMTVSRNEEVIEFDLSRASQAFSDLVFEQLIALDKVENKDSR